MNAWLRTARTFHRLGASYSYLNYIACASASILKEIKFEITERCNLACSFCHQDFGVRRGTATLDFSAYDRILALAKKERIGVVRLTGGEPLILKSVERYLSRAKELGFATIINTNATPLTEKRVAALKGLLDCVKISMPAPDEETTTALTGDANAWRRKWHAIERLERHGVCTHILTVMTSDNIEKFERFAALFEAHPAVVWKLLRAEAQDGGRHTVDREHIRLLAVRLREIRRQERWKNLTLGLGTPFCALENPSDALAVFGGGQSCGPFESLTVTSEGDLVRCYSRRQPVVLDKGLRLAGRELATEDFHRLPEVCRNCPYALWCRGGCRCEATLVDTSYGRLDYLADPANVAGSEAFIARRAAA
jgi:radical SAM protein with 4Fe4S-binding SPASM domain